SSCFTADRRFISAVIPIHFHYKTDRLQRFELKISVCTLSLDFFTRVTALVRTLLSESLVLLLNCFASFTRFSLCSRVTLEYELRSSARKPSVVWFRDFMDIWPSWLSGNLPSFVVTVMWLRLKSSFRVVRTAAMSSFTSSRLIISSTNAALMFTLAVCPFAFANIYKKKNNKEERNINVFITDGFKRRTGDRNERL
uniref:Uncharacterized protein n=1 Tax=Sinocyclocheilus rhinocerous TaxID=307959 RepID=A0A673N1H0_9TELE